MASLNKVMIMGNLTRDPEIRYTPRGTAVADLSLAINRSWKDDNGSKQEETTFVDVTLWGKAAELSHQYLTKGRGVFIEGRLQLDTWDDKDTGKKRSRLKIIGENMQFLPGGSGNPQASHATTQQTPPAARQQQQPPATNYHDDDEIPF